MYRAAFLPHDGDAWFTLRALDEAPCREKSWISDVSGFRDADDAIASVAKSIAARGYGTRGLRQPACWIIDNRDKPCDMRSPLSNDPAIFGKLAPQRIDDLGALADQ
jgi:hypothetical protein